MAGFMTGYELNVFVAAGLDTSFAEHRSTEHESCKRDDGNTRKHKPRHHDSKHQNPENADSNERLVKDLLRTIDEQKTQIKKLEKRNETIEQRRKETEKRSRDITKGMAGVMERKGNFENVNDVRANTNITERFNNLYDVDWVKLSRWLGQTFRDIHETDIIHSLTDLMRDAYMKCRRLADAQIRPFFLLDESQAIPDYKNHEGIYSLRKEYAQTETSREKVNQVMLKTIFQEKESGFLYTGENSSEAKRRILEFLGNYVDCCWLMVVSNPPISLNFDAIGKAYCKDHFRKYSPKKPVEDETKVENTVFEVVWPCVCLQDGSAFYKKGDVIVVSKGMLDAKNSDNASCSCFSREQGEPNSRAKGENGRPDSTPGSSNENSSGTVQQKKKSDV